MRDPLPSKNDERLNENLLWVKDAPLVIDDHNIARFYDAIVRPAYKENAPRTIKLTSAQSEELQTHFGGRIAAGLSGLWSSILNLEAEGTASRQRTKGSDTGMEQELVLEPITTSQRQLEQLIIFYSLVHPDRLLSGRLPDVLDWQRQAAASRLPRALALVDIPAGTRFIPMAAEFENGEVLRLYEHLATKTGKSLPDYDRDSKAGYWLKLNEMAEPANGASVIEEASRERGRIEWIDFRVLLDEEGHTVHLHMEPRRQYFTGAFAYMVVRRAVGHGLRLIGALKDGPDVNVLAVYEK